MNKTEYVPLDKADVPTSVCAKSDMTTIGLLDGRTVSVGLGTNNGIVVELESPLPDGKRSYLGFALTCDAACALIELIMLSLRSGYEKNHQKMGEQKGCSHKREQDKTES